MVATVEQGAEKVSRICLLIVLMLSAPVGCAETIDRAEPGIDWSVVMSEPLAAPQFTGRVLIATRGQVLFDAARGQADRESKLPIDKRTVFDVGSLTKQFTAAAVLALRDDGRIALDDTLEDYLEGLGKEKGGLTLHQLLTHTAGLPMYSGGDYETATKDDLIEWLREVDLEYPPGTDWAYSNPGYSLLALIVEDISDVTFEEYLRSRLFAPLGIEEIGYRSTTGPLAVMYEPDGTRYGTPVEQPWASDGPYWNLRGGGGILANPEALLRWFEALRSGEVLSEESTELMFAPHAKTSTDTHFYGYGWRVVEDERGRWIQHGGSNGATFYSHIRHFPQSDTTMVLTMNTFDIEQIRAIIGAFTDAAGASTEFD